MNGYDPRTDKIILEPDASLYVRFHEQAHQEQYRCAIWRFWFALRHIPGVNYLVSLWIEWDALRRARSVMQKLGVWNDAAEQEARRGFYSYVRGNRR